MNKKLEKHFSFSEVEEELLREKHKSKFINIFKSTVYAFIILISVVILVATLLMPVFEVNGSYMNPTIDDGDIVVAIKTKNLKGGDVIAFYHGNKILIKRVIASAGSWVNIDEKGNVLVDGNLLNEEYLTEKFLGDSDIEFPYQVPDGSYFVLSDNREISLDSRNSEIGSITKDNVIGKIVYRVWPLKNINLIK